MYRAIPVDLTMYLRKRHDSMKTATDLLEYNENFKRSDVNNRKGLQHFYYF